MRKLLIIIIWLTQKAVPKLLEREQAITFKGRYNLVGAAHLFKVVLVNYSHFAG
jgi:hypothetical protein